LQALPELRGSDMADQWILACGVILLWLSAMAAGPSAPCPIVPIPRVYKDAGRVAELLGPDAAAIVIGAKASEPERYAAERLQSLIERRFKRRLPIGVEGQLPREARQVILLGQRGSSGWLDVLCKRHRIDLGPTSPGHDGFVIEVVEDPTHEVILVGGCNARGVVYGQDAFFDLLRRDGDRVVFPVVSVRDWPSIPWRGRPISRPEVHLKPGTFDAYVRSRLNFVDLRDGPPPRRGQFGIPPGFKFDKPRAKQIVAEAHRRGLFVYGVVFCGVKPNQFDAALKTFEELVELGADGLWISFDDPGPGKDAPVLIGRVLAFANKHGMTGRAIATVPPTGSYQNIETDFNRRAAAVAGIDGATWFFTRVPCKGDVEAAGRIGLTRLPAWWHNWPRTTGGFTHGSYGGRNLRTSGSPYLDLPPLTVGWHRPRYERLRDAAKHTDTVMMWGGWPEEYVTGVLGIWAWNPAQHDWSRTRTAIYSYVFGPAQAEAARAYDDKLAKLKSLFHLPGRSTGANWPCRLKDLENRPAALKLVGEMDELLKTLEARAPRETTIAPTRLAELFLEPTRATVKYARAMAELDFPEYWYTSAGVEKRIIKLLEAGKKKEAQALLAQVRERVKPGLQRIPEALRGLRGIDEYVALWEKQIPGVAYWEKRIEARKAEAARQEAARLNAIKDMPKRFEALTQRDLSSCLAGADKPATGKKLAELGADDWKWTDDPPTWRGMWGIGTLDAAGRKAIAIAFPGRTRSEVGHYAEVRAELPTPKFQGRLILHAFINDTHVTTRWTRYRFMQLWLNDKMIWEEDIATSREGKEWIAIDVTDVARRAKRLMLRFRVIDKRPVSNYPTITFLGPVKLCAGREGR